MRNIHIEIKKSGKTVFKGEWDTLSELLKEPLPHVFGEHLAKRLHMK